MKRKTIHMSLEGNRFETIGDFKWCLECGGEVQFFWKGQRYGAVQYSFDNRRLYSIPFNQHSFSTDRKPAAKTANPSFPYPFLFASLQFSLFSPLSNRRFRCCMYRIPALQDRNKSDGLRWSASAQHISAFIRFGLQQFDFTVAGFGGQSEKSRVCTRQTRDFVIPALLHGFSVAGAQRAYRQQQCPAASVRIRLPLRSHSHPKGSP